MSTNRDYSHQGLFPNIATFGGSAGSIVSPWQMEIALGNIDGFSQVRKFGHNPDVDNSWETIWSHGGIYAYPASASVMSVSSSSADDVNTTGTGAWQVTISGLNTDYEEVSETVNLNGQNGVNTTTEFLRIHRIIVIAAGTGQTNAGDIYVGTGTITAGVPANVYGHISAGYAQTLMLLYTVPANKQAVAVGAQVYASDAKVYEARIMARPFGQVFQCKDLAHGNAGQISFDMPLFEILDEKTDIQFQATCPTGNADISGRMFLILIDKS